MSNLLKGFYTNPTPERIIDYNDIISSKIQAFKDKISKEQVEPDGFVSGISADRVENLIEEGSNQLDPLSLLAKDINSEQESVINDNNETANSLIEMAKAEAERIIEEASTQAISLREEAYNKGYQEGNQKGYECGEQRVKEEYQAMVDQVNEEFSRIEKEYNIRYELIEREVVETLLEVFSKITYTIAEDNKDIVLHLINQVMNNVEPSGDFYIRVSKDDYPFISANQGKIYNATAKDINVSIIEDDGLLKNQCIIETDGGVFDCSLDIQLEELAKDIKLLSCIK